MAVPPVFDIAEPVLLTRGIRSFLRYGEGVGWAGIGEVVLAILGFLGAVGLVVLVLYVHTWRARRGRLPA